VSVRASTNSRIHREERDNSCEAGFRHVGQADRSLWTQKGIGLARPFMLGRAVNGIAGARTPGAGMSLKLDYVPGGSWYRWETARVSGCGWRPPDRRGSWAVSGAGPPGRAGCRPSSKYRREQRPRPSPPGRSRRASKSGIREGEGGAAGAKDGFGLFSDRAGTLRQQGLILRAAQHAEAARDCRPGIEGPRVKSSTDDVHLPPRAWPASVGHRGVRRRMAAGGPSGVLSRTGHRISC